MKKFQIITYNGKQNSYFCFKNSMVILDELKMNFVCFDRKKLYNINITRIFTQKINKFSIKLWIYWNEKSEKTSKPFRQSKPWTTTKQII